MLKKRIIACLDVKKVKELKKFNIEGVIVGKAIYDGDINLNDLKELENA